MPADRFTVFGSRGFIGSHVLAYLKAAGHDVQVAKDHDLNGTGVQLGHVIYCAGVTSDFRTRPYDTIEAHVSLPSRIFKVSTFDSFLYLSSTRVYLGSMRTDEDSPLLVLPTVLDNIYNASKVAGEALTLAVKNPTARVVRLSNIFGDDFDSNNFLSTVLRGAIRRGEVTFSSGPASARDYLHVEDAVEAMIAVALHGKHRLYNVASAQNVTNADLALRLSELTGCSVRFEPGAAPTAALKAINTDRLLQEFDFSPSSVLDLLPRMLSLYRDHEKTHVRADE